MKCGEVEERSVKTKEPKLGDLEKFLYTVENWRVLERISVFLLTTG